MGINHQVLSKHRWISSSRLSQTAEQMLRRYPAHITGLIEICSWCRGVTFGFSSIAFDEDTSDDEEEYGAKGAGEGDEDDEAES